MSQTYNHKGIEGKVSAGTFHGKTCFNQMNLFLYMQNNMLSIFSIIV